MMEHDGADEAGMDDMEGEESLEAMKARLDEMEQEANKLKQMQARVEKEMGQAPGGLDPKEKEEVDSRSVYVGNVDYSCTPEELQQHFKSCGTVNRVTILTDKLGNPKGFAYIEFLEVDAVPNALLLSESELKGRSIKVQAKRTNVPGMKQHRGVEEGESGEEGLVVEGEDEEEVEDSLHIEHLWIILRKYLYARDYGAVQRATNNRRSERNGSGIFRRGPRKEKEDLHTCLFSATR
eukprot:CAMPEP_0183831486 /NCGR_PEP_ID=MMETSP0807_2-20130328/4703_1 /TAXON_ID=88271 /ORGANISM="Picocystis salinarum, Strain CCMP1897" /LENGTH=236 /DNA_ID=CAMNT_0026076975 /DNA_START=47 /DNA_END=758 /DNA_ORIENTATION=-